MLTLYAALALASAGGTMSAQAQAREQQDIVVTGRRLSDTERALAECLARKCPPDADIDATLAHAENLFVAGEYRQARTILKASMRRNGAEAKRYPEPVADLNRASGRVAAHLGFGGDYYSYTWGILRALKKGLPEQDLRHFSARMEIAEMSASVRGSDAAKIVYGELAADARKAGATGIAALAELRSAWLSHLENPQGEGRRQLARIAANPEAPNVGLAAKVLLARIARNEGREDATEALIGEMAALKLRAPTLLYAPRWELAQQEIDGGGSVLKRLAADNFDDKWIDVGYWVQPDGRVTELEILRRSGDSRWANSLLRSIGGRVYSPTDAAEGGVYRVERYTYTSRFEDRTGTRIQRRSPQARVEYLDLTAETPRTGS